MAAGSASAAQVGAAVNRILDLLQASPDGLSQDGLNDKLGPIGQAGALALNRLLQKRQVQIFQQGSTHIYKLQPKEEAGKFKGLTPDDMLVYQVIQQSSTMGIWTKDMKRNTNLQQPQVAKAIKNLEARNLIKAVRSIASKGKKVYMLAELKPSKELTGGAWYTDQVFDSEFINVMKQQCLQFVLKQGLASVESIADAVRKSGITKEELRVKDFKQLMDMLVLDGEVEETVSTGAGPFAAFPPDTLLYRSSQSRICETSAFTSIPCGVCPVRSYTNAAMMVLSLQRLVYIIKIGSSFRTGFQMIEVILLGFGQTGANDTSRLHRCAPYESLKAFTILPLVNSFFFLKVQK